MKTMESGRTLQCPVRGRESCHFFYFFCLFASTEQILHIFVPNLNFRIMEVIKLGTNQHRLNELISEKTNIFTHEIRPETNSLFCDLDEEGYVIDIDGVLQPRHYDALRLSSGQRAHYFAIGKAEIELFSNRSGKLITYRVNGEEYIKAQIVYYLIGELQS